MMKFGKCGVFAMNLGRNTAMAMHGNAMFFQEAHGGIADMISMGMGNNNRIKLMQMIPKQALAGQLGFAAAVQQDHGIGRREQQAIAATAGTKGLKGNGHVFRGVQWRV